MPSPSPDTAGYGGDTCCVEVRTPGGTALILDAGMGLHWLGRSLMEGAFGSGQGQAHLLLTHTHWSHIQGIPFFVPLLIAGNQFTLYGPGEGEPLQDAMRQQLHPIYCPVPNFFNDQVGATVRIEEVEEGDLTIGDAQVKVRRVNHSPGSTCFAYRLEAGGRALAYIPDIEYSGEADRRPALELAHRVDLLFHDAHCGDGCQHAGCGHSSAAQAVALALEAGVRRLALFHHHPERTDQEIDSVVAAHQQRGLVVEGARQGQVYKMSRKK
ncbi:MAG: MBL fold metallo-hydrolase [Candidatus Latescibacteria bacterium]|nr:MBL fold metallo-hydrolase [Candidatus Latescibacterota bacterium]